MRKLFFYIFCFYYLLGCKNNDPIGKVILIDKLPYANNIESQKIEIPPILLRTSATCIVDSFLIVAQTRPDSIFSIFELPDCKYLLSFGNRGRGPNEFLNSVPSFTLGPAFNKQGSFAVDNLRNNIQYYNIYDVIDSIFTPYKIESFPSKIDGFRSIGYFSDTMLIGAPNRIDILLLKSHSSNKQIKSFKKYPNKYAFDDFNNLRNVYSGRITVKPDNSRFALAYGNKGCIEIYNINDTLPITISYKDFPSLEDNLGLNNDSKYWTQTQMIFCWGMKSSNRYIYAKIYNDKYTSISDGKGLIRTYIPELTVFDWSGKLIVRLKPDNFYTEFEIDQNDKYLYTIDDNIENVIRRYDISNYLSKR